MLTLSPLAGVFPPPPSLPRTEEQEGEGSGDISGHVGKEHLEVSHVFTLAIALNLHRIPHCK